MSPCRPSSLSLTPGTDIDVYAVVNWLDDQRRARQGETVVDDHVVVAIMQSIVDIVPNAGMIIIVGDGDGGDNGRGSDACL